MVVCALCRDCAFARRARAAATPTPGLVRLTAASPMTSASVVTTSK